MSLLFFFQIEMLSLHLILNLKIYKQTISTQIIKQIKMINNTLLIFQNCMENGLNKIYLQFTKEHQEQQMNVGVIETSFYLISNRCHFTYR